VIDPVTRPCFGSNVPPPETSPLRVSLLAAFGWLPPPLIHAYTAVASAVRVYVIELVPTPASSNEATSAPLEFTLALADMKWAPDVCGGAASTEPAARATSAVAERSERPNRRFMGNPLLHPMGSRRDWARAKPVLSRLVNGSTALGVRPPPPVSAPVKRTSTVVRKY